jgi:amidase
VSRTKKVQKSMNGASWQWTACELAGAIAAREISSREAVESCLARLERVNPRINAVADVLADEALTAADRADAITRRGDRLGMLHGVPVTIKINVDYAGRATTNGVVAFQDRIAAADSPPVANWRKAGAIVVGRTNVPAFSARFFTDNALYGRTLNPWAPDRTPGGSSGGAAAAVATGIGALAHGNDRAGSIRYPAYACGVWGLRPTIGRVPSFSGEPREPTLVTQLTHVQGPLARNVADLRLAFHTMAVRDPRDPWWVPAPLDQASLQRPFRIALFIPPASASADDAVVGAVKSAARWLQDAGCVVEEAAPPRLQEAAELFFSLIRTEERTGTTRAIEEFGDDALRRARASTMAAATEMDFAGYVQAFARRASMLREWQLFFERFPLLLMPISYRLPLPIDFDQRGDQAVKEMLNAHQPMLAISSLGLPGLAVPTGIADGVPVGVQLVAGRFQEELCLAAGAMIENNLARTTPIDPIAA